MQFSMLPSADAGKRAAAKTLLVFFITILLLTFFSNTINNFSLPKVTTCSPQQGSLIKTVNGEGEVEAVDKEDIYFEGDLNAKIEKIEVKQGDVVRKGDVLFVLRESDINMALTRENLLLSKLKLTYEQSEEAYSSGSGVITFKRAVDSAREQLEESRNRLKNAKELFAAGMETGESLRQDEKSVKAAEKELKNMLEDYDAACKGRLTELKKLEYDLKLQEVKLNGLKDGIKTGNTICSPCDGRVREIYAAEGMWINSASKLCTVENYSKGYEFDAEIDTDSAALIEAGDNASIRIKSLGTNAVGGIVKEIRESKTDSGRMKLAVISIQDNKVKGGEKGDVHIEKSTKNYGIIVPNSAVLPGKSRKEGFIRLLREKEGFLGNEYYTEFVNVAVLDSDNGFTAVSGVIGDDDRIIAECDKPLNDKSRVIPENQTDYAD